MIYYSAGGIEKAKEYVVSCGLGDVRGVGEGQGKWWESVLEDSELVEEETLEVEKKDTLQRISLNQRMRITEELVEKFVNETWRTETANWGSRCCPKSIDPFLLWTTTGY